MVSVASTRMLSLCANVLSRFATRFLERIILMLPSSSTTWPYSARIR
jgi:hypothetical protein